MLEVFSGKQATWSRNANISQRFVVRVLGPLVLIFKDHQSARHRFSCLMLNFMEDKVKLIGSSLIHFVGPNP